jgi:ribosome-associated heat shock protein Hsp15
MPEKEKLRLDKYLWAIRLFKTRSLATAACESGKVKFNGTQTKPSKNVNVDEEYEIKTEAKRWRIRVSGLIYKRVAFAEAINYYIDITPAEEIERLQYLRKESLGQAASFHTGKRMSKIGRPTKKQRRDIDHFLDE